MKTLIIAINSKYIHTMPSAYLLQKSHFQDVEILETNINISTFEIMNKVKKYENIELFCLPSYIFNIKVVRNLIAELREDYPNSKIAVGGPEVSYGETSDTFADYILLGEGERNFKKLVDGELPLGVTKEDRTDSLDEYESIYNDENMQKFENKIVYFESSRGCPYSCSYCLSSCIKGVTYYSIERVKKDLSYLISKKIPQVKFIDRTFNADKKRSKEIFKFLMEKCQNVDINFHFECAGDIFDEETISLLQSAKKGLFQFEIGMQSLNEKTLLAVNRKTDTKKLIANIEAILKNQNIHLHLDLIAGLPFEDLESFKKSFNGVYALKPHMLQLGFLKLLKGTKIREESEKYGFTFNAEPPYEFLSNDFLSKGDIEIIKFAEIGVDLFYNSGKFFESFKFIQGDSFDNFVRFGKMAKTKKINDLFCLMFEVLKENGVEEDVAREVLKFDYFVNRSGFMYPEFLELRRMISRISNNVYAVKFTYNPKNYVKENLEIVFDYNKKDRVTGKYDYVIKKL